MPAIVLSSDCSHYYAKMISNPSLVFKAQLRDGQNIVVEDYLDSYLWLNKNTPDDARVLSWCVRHRPHGTR